MRESGTPAPGGPGNGAGSDFNRALERHGLHVSPLAIDTLQVNMGRLCNQACRHCHVDASPHRTELMDRNTVDQCLKVLAGHAMIKSLDITGGAPELNPHFDYLVVEARKLDKHVMVRHNLTVTFDGNPRTGEAKTYLPGFFAAQQVEIVSSLPYYQEYFTDKQRGRGVFAKSIAGMQQLNALGFGLEGSPLQLNLVFNPVGAFLPAPQENLETDFKRELHHRYGVFFNRLFTMTNMPVHRFRDWLARSGMLEEYMEKLVGSFNPAAAGNVMCRSLISVGIDGRLYDCDFNQMLDIPANRIRSLSIFDFDAETLLARPIEFRSHCFGCTAGAGSSCTGATS